MIKLLELCAVISKASSFLTSLSPLPVYEASVAHSGQQTEDSVASWVSHTVSVNYDSSREASGAM